MFREEEIRNMGKIIVIGATKGDVGKT